VWSSATPPLPTNTIDADEDGVQQAFPLLITNNPSDATLCKTLFTLWYIWKARNDNRFQRKTWTSLQVHQSASAHMQSHLDAIYEHLDDGGALHTASPYQPHDTNIEPSTLPSHGTSNQVVREDGPTVPQPYHIHVQQQQVTGINFHPAGSTQLEQVAAAISINAHLNSDHRQVRQPATGTEFHLAGPPQQGQVAALPTSSTTVQELADRQHPGELGRDHLQPIHQDRFLVPSPSLLDGIRCYTDASTEPDHQAYGPRAAGLGIFIVNTQANPPHSIFIKAAMRSASSVLMAEAAAMALAAKVLDILQLQQGTILNDNQQLVHFLNGTNLAHPPDWRIKPYTQLITSSVYSTTTAIRRINRRLNQMADSLARQALNAIHCNQFTFEGVCAHAHHDPECPVIMALQNVTINNVMVLTASCC
jgi:ribonuclease HI